MNYAKTRKYFCQKSTASIVASLSIIAIVLFLTSKISWGIICIAIAVGIYFLTRRPSDAEIDAIVQEEFQSLKAAALKKLGLDEEEIAIADPVLTVGYSFQDDRGRLKITDGNIECASFIKGKDFKWRSPIVGMHFFGFAENEIHYYYRYISLVSDTIKEGTNVINYKDVVSVRSDTECVPAINLKTNEEDPREKVKFDIFAVNVPGDKIVCSTRDSNVADEAVNALRALIKQRKNA